MRPRMIPFDLCKTGPRRALSMAVHRQAGDPVYDPSINFDGPAEVGRPSPTVCAGPGVTCVGPDGAMASGRSA